MSKQTLSIIVVVAILVAGGILLFILLRPPASPMSGGPGMLYFYSPTCPICNGMKPVIAELEEAYGGEFKIVRIDVTRPAGEDTARELGLVGQPNYVFFDSSDEETRRMAGPQSYEVMASEIERTLNR